MSESKPKDVVSNPGLWTPANIVTTARVVLVPLWLPGGARRLFCKSGDARGFCLLRYSFSYR